ncbi:hypothetical protein MLD38_033849 [Melastoma candidum]|uniref:Uncharacterized protein n=1 Tax=Melastoma candidum TaxID=119954 RepID=A0ACB9MBU7_9MYRT|nr:hypothetical protein MLD38_033849 [Melastoma candidum]
MASIRNFDILDNGRLHVLSLSGSTGPAPITSPFSFNTDDGIHDLAWSESHDSFLIAAVAVGSLKLLDTSLPPTANPVRSLSEHSREASSLDFHPTRRASFLSSSWDDSVELWALDRPQSLRTFLEQSYCVLSVSTYGMSVT